MRAGTRTVGWRAEADGTPGWAPEMTTLQRAWRQQRDKRACSGVGKTWIQVLTLPLRAAGPERDVSSCVAAVSSAGGNEVLVRRW